MVKAKVFVQSKAFDGPAEISNFKLVEEDLPELKDGEFLVEAAYLSVDPYMRSFTSIKGIGKTCMGEQVARVKESKNTEFPVGRYVIGPYGWRSHTISKESEGGLPWSKPHLLPEFGNLSPSLGLGILGMPGNTAYFGLLEVLKPKAGETLVVSGAAGAVGSVVGQIAKIKGLKVIGIAGSDKKGEWIIKELGFDQFINYKSDTIAKKLQEYAPEGIDCYFDNTGGDITSAVLQNMKTHGRIAVCGVISSYNGDKSKACLDEISILSKQLTVTGFAVYQWLDRWMEAMEQNLKWIQEGKLKCRETVTDGFENMPKAFIDMMNGHNFGKAIVKA